MAKPTISKSVDRYDIITADTATAPALVQRDANFPSGDLAIRALNIRYDATVGGTGTPTKVTNGNRFYLNALTVETDKHGKLVDAVDGLMLYNMNTLEFGTTPNETQMSSTPADTDTPSASWTIPFSSFRGRRPYDTNLDMIVSRMRVSSQYGAYSNLWTQGAGSPVVKTLNQSIEARVLPGPIFSKPDPAVPGSDDERPQYVRTLEQKSEPITADENRHQIAIPYGDRIWRRLLISQRRTDTKVELSTVALATAEISFYVAGTPVVDRRLLRDIQSDNKRYYGLEAIPTGLAVLDFDEEFQDSIFNTLWTLTNDAGNAYLYVDVKSVTSGSLLLGFDCLKPIPAAAKRA